MKIASLLMFSLIIVSNSFSQAVGIGTTTPNNSAMLDVVSPNKGFLAPRMNSLTRTGISSPAPGLMVFDTTTGSYWYYSGSSWVNLAATTAPSPWIIIGNDIYNSNSGSIGMGTSTPAAKLHVTGSIIMDRTNAILQLQTAGVDKGFVQLAGNDLRLGTNSNNGSGKFIVRTGGGDRLFIDSIGQVGIGTSVPVEKLTVSGNALIKNGGSIFLDKSSGTRTVEIKSTESGVDGASILLYNNAGVVTIEMDADYGDGDGRVITSELQIKGGSDLSEKFDVSDAEKNDLKPGMLVSIDTDNDGMLCITKEVNDKKIVGVISGANGIKTGMLMGQEESIANGKYAVALVGRVYVLSTNEGGEINPGDFLTSSSKAGFAKKALNFMEAQGAIIGKAMGKADPTTGYVLVLINLQ